MIKGGGLNVFIFIGPPGSGKGSLSQLCAQKLGWKQISTGNLCRKQILEQTEIGKKIDFAIKSGKLISDGLITKMVEKWFSNQSDKHGGVILDGYPRTVVQAQAFNQLLKTTFKGVRCNVIRFSISDQSVIERLGSRYICQNKECQAVYSLAADSSLAPKRTMTCDLCSHPLMRRKDDEEGAIRERLKAYYQHEQNLLQFYTETGQQIREVSVEKSLDNVFSDFTRLLEIEVS